MPTVDGNVVEVEVPAGTQSGQVLRVRQAGLPGHGGGRRGDLRLRRPRRRSRPTSTPNSASCWKQLAELRGEPLAARGRGLFTRLRDAFR